MRVLLAGICPILILSILSCSPRPDVDSAESLKGKVGDYQVEALAEAGETHEVDVYIMFQSTNQIIRVPVDYRSEDVYLTSEVNGSARIGLSRPSGRDAAQYFEWLLRSYDDEYVESKTSRSSEIPMPRIVEADDAIGFVFYSSPGEYWLSVHYVDYHFFKNEAAIQISCDVIGDPAEFDPTTFDELAVAVLKSDSVQSFAK